GDASKTLGTQGQKVGRLGLSKRERRGRMSATLLSEDGEARLARLAWRELQRYIAKYPQLELTRASEIAKYLRELAVGPRGKDNVRDAIVQHVRFARRHGYLGEDRISERHNQTNNTK